MSPKTLVLFRRKLLRWYSQARRDLPWRRTRDPYAIWVAETMLQQTQVATVTRYYERFLEAFPTVESLDRAPLPKVLALWSGLGYYRRAANLKRSARVLIRNHNGRLPDHYAELRALPGVGDYTAGAVLSIAFDKPYPAVDGNARRVIGRLFKLRNDKQIRNIAAHFVPAINPGYFNQALMELGATICGANNPRCPECPLGDGCKSRNSGRKFAAGKSQIFENITWPLAIVRRKRTLLLRRRPANGILAGLWEFPGGETTPGKSVQAHLKQHLEGVEASLSEPKQIGEMRHNIANRKIRSPVFLFDVKPVSKPTLPSAQWRWSSRQSLNQYPLSSMTLKAANLLALYEESSL